MDRRTFVLLTGAASGALLRSPARAAGPAPSAAAGRLAFELDEHRRWSLWYLGAATPVPLVRGAILGAWLGDRLVTLGDLQDTVTGHRRPPGGEALVVRGRAAGAYLEAEFLMGEPANLPRAAVSLTIYPDRDLPLVGGVRFADVSPAAVLPGDAPLVALVAGRDSESPSRIVALPLDAAAVPSHGILGLSRAGQGLGLAFDADDPGNGRVDVGREELVAISEWRPPRPLRAAGDTSSLRLCYAPAGDAQDALAALFVPPSPVDRERMAQLVAPAGWCSWHALYGGVTEEAVMRNLEFCAAQFGHRDLRVIQLGDGYQRAAGDWEPNEKFPRGHRWLTDQIHGRGFLAGLWLAPLAVSERSGLPDLHGDWLLRDARGPVVIDAREPWGGDVFALDGAHPAVQEWLFALARRAVRGWGYDYLTLDFLGLPGTDARHAGDRTHAEAYRAALSAVRDGAGTDAVLHAARAPLQHAVGLVNVMRIGPAVHPSWGGVQAPARAAALRRFYHRSAWLNDPGRLVVRPPLTIAEARAWASVVALTGGVTFLADDLATLPPDRLAILQRTLPPAPVAGRPGHALPPDHEPAPALLAGDRVFPLESPWRFRTGDDPAYAARDFDDAVWETTPIPGPWERAGHAGHDGYAWYRAHVTLPALPAPSAVTLELGRIDDADETFVNGVRVGGTGAFPPAYQGASTAYRRYPVPVDALIWGGGNVIAVRMYDGGGAGGLWNTRRDPAPRTWVVEGAPQWWTVAVVNWDDEPAAVSLPLDDLGLPRARLAAYDIWNDVPLPEVRERLTARLEARTALVVALRSRTDRPQVVGTTRHVVQGAVDMRDEAWDAATDTASGRGVALGQGPYRVTLAVPRGLVAAACAADPPCELHVPDPGHVVLAWPSGDGRDVAWRVQFRTADAGR